MVFEPSFDKVVGLDMRSRRKVAFQMKNRGAVGDMAGKFSGTDPAGSL